MVSVSELMRHKSALPSISQVPELFSMPHGALGGPGRIVPFFQPLSPVKTSNINGLRHLLHRFSCFSAVLCAYIVYVVQDVFGTSLG